jgi:hypothetical protein
MTNGTSAVKHTEKFTGAKNGMSMFFAYFGEVAKEIGMDRALALNTRMFEAMGAAAGQAIREESGGNGVDAVTAGTLAGRHIQDTMGFEQERVEMSPEQIICACGQCPIYEAAKDVGMDAAAIEAVCRTGSIPYMDAFVRQLNPRLSYRLTQFRSSAAEPCKEEIVLG